MHLKTVIILTTLDTEKYLTIEFDRDSFESLFNAVFLAPVAAAIIFTCHKMSANKKA